MRAAGAAIAGVLALLAPAGAAFASPQEADPGVKVAPGVYLASASELAEGGASASGANVPQPRSSPRIVGGSATTIEEWPWQAAVTENPFPPASNPGNGFQRQFCGGSLVAPTIVITAAHCTFEVFGSSGFDDPINFASITGRTTLSNNAQGQESAWTDYHFFVDGSGNQLFNPNTMEWDVVFAELASPSPSTPIALAGADEAASWAPGDENAFATGWGTIFFMGPSSDTLREVQIDMLADSVCGAATSYGSDFKPETMVCAGEALGGQDTCQGDSGGPLVVPVGGGAFRLVGDTSFGNACALPNFPGVYGRLAQDPMCGALQNGIQAEAGVDVVGPGGCRAALDAAPPETLITKGPKNKTKKKKATFEFTSSEPGSSFDCTVDGRSPKAPCTSPIRVKVKKGRHTFQVRATDPAGNADPTPASDSWKRKKKKKRKK
jgi:trypsin